MENIMEDLFLEIKNAIKEAYNKCSFELRDQMYEKLKEYACFLAERRPEPEWLRCMFTTISVYFGYDADTYESDELLLEIWNSLKKSDFALSFYSQYADDDRDDEYEEATDPLMARYENGFENFMVKYII